MTLRSCGLVLDDETCQCSPPPMPPPAVPAKRAKASIEEIAAAQPALTLNTRCGWVGAQVQR